MVASHQVQVKKSYVSPELRVKGDISELTQTKSWGSGDSFIMSININPAIADVINNITHYS